MIRVDGTGRSNSLIQVRGLDKTYRRGGEEIQVLQRLNLDVDKAISSASWPQRLRQNHPAQFAWRIGRPDARQHHRGWR